MVPFDKKVEPIKKGTKTMIRHLKTLGFSLVALLAMSAMMASVASAHTPADFTIEKAPALITATQKTEHKFTVTGQTVTCAKAEFHGTAKQTTETEITISPTYTECKTAITNATVTGFGHLHEEITHNAKTVAEGKPEKKCGYILKANGGAALECTGGADVTVDAGPCVVHVPPQEFASGVTYSTETKEGKHDLTVNFEIKNIKATHTDGFLCPFGSSGEGTEAILEGTSTATARTELGEELVHLTHDPTVP